MARMRSGRPRTVATGSAGSATVSRPRSPSHAAKHKTPEDRVGEFGHDVAYVRLGALVCRACTVALDHSRRSTIVEHFRSYKHRRNVLRLRLQPMSPQEYASEEPMLKVEEDEDDFADEDFLQEAASPDPPAYVGPYLLKKETHCHTVLDQLLHDETFADVTLTAEGHSIKAHRIVLSLASPYFRQVLGHNLNVQSVIVLRDVKFTELQALIQFIYTGETTVEAVDFESFMHTADMLEVTCLGTLGEGHKLPPVTQPLVAQLMEQSTRVPKRTASSKTVKPAKSRRVVGTSTAVNSLNHSPIPPKFITIVKEEISDCNDTAFDDEIVNDGIETEAGFKPPFVVSENDSANAAGPSNVLANDAGPSKLLANDSDFSDDSVIPGRCPYCPDADQTYTNETNLHEHLLSHVGKPLFPCNICLRVYLRRNRLQRHQINCRAKATS